MKPKMTESRFLLYSVSAIFLLMAIHIFQPQLKSIYQPINYTGIHTLLEVLSISVSAVIFFYGLKNFGTNRSRRMLLISFSFFLIAMLDLLHTLSFKGMPYFITESSVAKATWFWIIARTVNAFAMLAILLVRDKTLTRDFRGLNFALSLSLTAMIAFFVFKFEGSLPLLMVEGTGTTLLKNIMEYFISFILFVSLLITLYQYYNEKSAAKLAIGLALVFLLLTELIFTIYHSIYDLDNFSGHIFKVFGFYFILKGFYFEDAEEDLQKQEQVPQQFLNELPGFIFKVEKKGDTFIPVFGEGELLRKLGADGENLSLTELFQSSIIPIEEYFRLTLKLRETFIFEVPYREKLLLFSLRPLSNAEDGTEALAGTVSDMTGIHHEPPLNQNDRKNFKIVM